MSEPSSPMVEHMARIKSSQRLALEPTVGRQWVRLYLDGVPFAQYEVDSNPATLIEVETVAMPVETGRAPLWGSRGRPPRRVRRVPLAGPLEPEAHP